MFVPAGRISPSNFFGIPDGTEGKRPSMFGKDHYLVKVSSPEGKPVALDNGPGRGVDVTDIPKDFTVTRYPNSLIKHREVVRRAWSQRGRPYSLHSFNCEHYSTFAFDGVPKSKQFDDGVRRLAFGAGIAGALLLLLKSFDD